MPAKNPDLHGSAPDRSPVALLLIDVVNALDFEGGERLLENALPMARAIARLKRRAKQAGIPVIYANDNYGQWQSDFRGTVAEVDREGVRGRPLLELLRPEEGDYSVLKPKHSGFFSTPLELLLEHFGTRTLILTGVSTHVCVLFTANDAYMRDLFVVVPEDCVAAENEASHENALHLMRSVMGADTTVSDRLDLEALLERGGAGEGQESGSYGTAEGASS